MKISDKSILFICIFGLFGRMLIAQENQTGTTAASFLEIGIGSRAVGMGGAYVAMAEGPTAAYWNPAGLGMMDHTEVSVMHMNWVTDIDMQSVSFGLPIPQWFTIGKAPL